MNYYERYCGDYQRDTAHLSLVEHGAFTMLLDTYYATEKPLGFDSVSLFRICRAITEEERAAVLRVVDEFFPVGEDGLRHNKRADELITITRSKLDAKRENGKKGGRPRKQKEASEKLLKTEAKTETKSEVETEQKPNDKLNESSPTPAPTPLIKPKKLSAHAETASSKSTDEPDEDFEQAWRAYPKREGGNSKAAALKAWRARIRDGIEPQRLIAATQAYAAEMQSSSNVGTRFVKQAATFFGPDQHFAEYAAADHGEVPQAANEWWVPAGFSSEWEARNDYCVPGNAHLWRDRRPVRKLPGVYVEPWPEGRV
ncbi:YdaU family protein [Pandoraea pnomenusa]|uniref:YdaU family protein n=1 Tax=Pandoraea pnomenusa TaxID=93220 RepID=UPI001AC6CEC4|nr:DUF1376 domain-containing protein [Pandoraea pnomenusa]MBN9093890.1 DUF1376 domain-containing protein [Pandoraea pnomenusa]